MATDTISTPVIRQYEEMKSKHPDAVLLFRLGDFYECFKEDAVTTSDILGITLTHRKASSGTIEMAGFPQRNLDNYLSKLVSAGKRICFYDSIENINPHYSTEPWQSRLNA